jgi:hypothetical protein
MNAPIWAGSAHVLACARWAAAKYTKTIIESNDWNDPFLPPLPTQPTSWSGPANLFPANGGYYDRAQIQGQDARPAPFVEVTIGQPFRAEYTDSTADFWNVPVAIRARVGLSSSRSTQQISTSIAALQAQSLARAACIAVARYTVDGAALLDPEGSAGILYAEILSDPIRDVSAPYPPDGFDAQLQDAVGMVIVTQRQFSPAGVRAVDLTPKPPPTP